LGGSPGAAGGVRLKCARPLTLLLPPGLNESTTRRTSGGIASSRATSIGSDSVVKSMFTTDRGPGRSIVPLAVSGLPATKVRNSIATSAGLAVTWPETCSIG
jgi:hypothetical protein